MSHDNHIRQVPPVLSRQVPRVIALPQRAGPQHRVISAGPGVVSSGGFLPHRLTGNEGHSHHTPTHEDMMSTVQPGTGGASTGRDPSMPRILTSGTYQVGGPGQAARVQVAHVNFDRPRACTAYVGIVPGSTVDTSGLFTLLCQMKFGRDKGATWFNFDIPAPVTNAYGRGPVVAIPLTAQDIDMSVRIIPFGSATPILAWNNLVSDPVSFVDPPDLQPGAIPAQVFNVTAWISEGEAVPRLTYPARRAAVTLIGAGHLTVPVCQGCDRAMVLADPTAGVTWEQTGVGAFDIANLPPNTQLPLPIAAFADHLRVNATGAASFELIQYLSV